ncbi:hypothetical protein [Metabacillus lacus]|uniref:hypothetical protein n=1 Tax=Metabacillus lacus TaxID=1983721 RepID=UPI00147834CF|nr:hypothetical protein [Metabacillus lacus]
MAGIIFLFFVIGFLLYVGAFHYFKLFQSSASYPPKRTLKDKVFVLVSGGSISLLISFMLYWLQ